MIGTVINGYKILKEIGKGGMATVYYAENSLGKAVAVKVLNDEFSKKKDIQNRFRKEADIMVALDGVKGVCRVYDRVNLNGKLFIIMEYLDGITMKQYVKEKGPIRSFDLLRNLCRQILTTLDDAHRLGIIHRDIKPSNLFYTTHGEVKILDFGISKVLFGADKKETIKEDTEGTDDENDETTTKQKFGTLAYMSPEQIKCTAEVDKRTDIYSFGMTLYYIMTGKDPLLMDDDSLSEMKDVAFLEALKHATRKDKDRRTPDGATFLKEMEVRKIEKSKNVPSGGENNKKLPGARMTAPVPPPARKRDTKVVKRVFWILLFLIVAEYIWNIHVASEWSQVDGRRCGNEYEIEQTLNDFRKKKELFMQYNKGVSQVSKSVADSLATLN